MKNYGSAKLALLLNAKFVAAQLTDQDRALSESPFMVSLVEEVGLHELCTKSNVSKPGICVMHCTGIDHPQ